MKQSKWITGIEVTDEYRNGYWVERNWDAAQLRAPLSETTWAIWRYEWPFAAGDNTFGVRCAEAAGTPQIEKSKKARPDGSSGIHGTEETL
jgi:DMSO/TMAO reductase YedYZ molybdopterin-dependent catalytic subunit